MTSWNLPPWDQQTFSFGWTPYVHTMQQCSRLKISFDTDVGSFHPNPHPAPPYTVIVYTGGYQPLTLAVGNVEQEGTYSWVVNLPLGPMYMPSMKDSAGHTGGVSLRWSMTPGTGCTLDPIAITDVNGNSAVDGIMTVGTSNDNTCLNAAATVSVGMATSMYSGSGVILPTTASTADVPSATRSSDNESTATTSAKTPIIVGVVAGVVAVLFVLSILYRIYRRQRRRDTSRPVDEIQQYQYDALSNILHARRGLLSYQYPAAVVPEIQTPEPRLYDARYPTPRHESDDAYINQANFSNITTCVPQPQSFQIGQAILLSHNPSPGQSPHTTRFSPSTGMASPSLGGLAGRQPLNTATSGMQYEDEKQRVAPPGLPPGAMPGPHEQPWVPKTPGSPSSSNVHSFLKPPPPYQHGTTTL
ncbi:hypothetical protein RSAG8_09664, partial [Rhizoctonia solani AG-8 WAC10335]